MHIYEQLSLKNKLSKHEEPRMHCGYGKQFGVCQMKGCVREVMKGGD